MSVADRREKYRRALAWLSSRSSHVAAAVMALGHPVFDVGTATAYAAIGEGGRPTLGFNPDFFDSLEVRPLATVLAHEAAHYIHRHVFVVSPTGDPEDAHRYNLACDAVVNDLLRVHDPELPFPGEPVTGERLIGRSTVGMTAEQVFALLEGTSNHPAENPAPLDDHSRWGGSAGGAASGPLGGRPPRSRRRQRAAQHPVLGRAPGGTQPLARGREIPSQEAPRGVNLEALLGKRYGRQRQQETLWLPPNRRMTAFYPEILLPAYRVRETRRVLIALDTSGSIPDNLLGLFAAIARRPLEDAVVEAISFDTEAYPFTPNRSDVCPLGGGGTDFMAIERFALSRPHYPDVIVVLTDGGAARPTLRHPERWIWLLTQPGLAEAFHDLGEVVLLTTS